MPRTWRALDLRRLHDQARARDSTQRLLHRQGAVQRRVVLLLRQRQGVERPLQLQLLRDELLDVA
jgi:hypothetical protein